MVNLCTFTTITHRNEHGLHTRTGTSITLIYWLSHAFTASNTKRNVFFII